MVFPAVFAGHGGVALSAFFQEDMEETNNKVCFFATMSESILCYLCDFVRFQENDKMAMEKAATEFGFTKQSLSILAKLGVIHTILTEEDRAFLSLLILAGYGRIRSG